MSFNSDYNEILLILDLWEKRQQEDLKIIKEILARMKNEHEQRLWVIQQNGDSQ